MMFYKFIRYDLMYGLLYRWRAYALTFLLFTLSCSPMISLHHRASQTFVNLPSFTYGDHILYLFAGMKEYIPSSGERFFLPTLWIFVILLFLYLTLYYPYRELMGFGKQMIVLSQHRVYWWISKCVWAVSSAFLYSVVLVAAALLFAYFTGAESCFAVSELFPSFLPFAADSLHAYPWNLFSFFAAVPFVFMLLGLLELLLSLILRPIFSFVIVSAYVLLGTYFKFPVFIGNFAMAARSEVFVSDGFSPSTGILICCFGRVITICAGWLYFRRMDIMSTEH